MSMSIVFLYFCVFFLNDIDISKTTNKTNEELINDKYSFIYCISYIYSRSELTQK